jgi:rod shape-determining protein MreD
MKSRLLLIAGLYLAAGLLAVVLQTSLFPRLGLTTMAPGLSFILIVSLPTIFPVWLGTLLAITLGLLTDIVLLAGSSFHACGFLVLFYLLVYLRQTIFFDRLPYQALMAGLAQLVLFVGVQLFTAGPDAAYREINLFQGFCSALVTGLVAVPVLYGLRPLSRLTARHPKLATPP